LPSGRARSIRDRLRGKTMDSNNIRHRSSFVQRAIMATDVVLGTTNRGTTDQNFAFGTAAGIDPSEKSATDETRIRKCERMECSRFFLMRVSSGA
jgi:hypothetical protein